MECSVVAHSHGAEPRGTAHAWIHLPQTGKPDQDGPVVSMSKPGCDPITIVF